MNPIIQNMTQKNNLLNALSSGGNPDQIYRYMMQNNPQFAQFINQNKGKTPQQIAESYGINPAILKQFMR